MTPVDIVLAVRNGERYLPDFLRSLSCQDFSDWRLVARDDASSDSTVQLLREHFSNSQHQFRLVEDNLGNVGAKENFSLAAKETSAPYVMFADQDDYWLPNKITESLRAIREQERVNWAATPILCHSDLVVVDQNLNIMSPSFWAYQNVGDANSDTLPKLLIQNCVTGCTSIVNRRLLQLALPIPKEAIMHDYWLSLVAACFGNIGRIADCPILYRQHGSNDTGAKRWGLKYIWRIARNIASKEPKIILQSSLDRKISQCRELQRRYMLNMTEHTKDVINGFSSLDKMNWWQRRMFIARHGIFMQGFSRNIALFLFL